METNKAATLHADGRTVHVSPCESSALGRTDGVAVIARTPSQVRALMSCLPGRVLVLTESAVTPIVVDLIESAISHGTFSGIVVNGRSPFAAIKLPVPVVEVDDEETWSPQARRTPLRLLVEVSEELNLRVADTRSRTAAGA